MKILFISPYVPNLIRVRPYNFIRHLAKHGNEVTLLTLWSDKAEKRDLEDIQQYCRSVYAFELKKTRSYWNCLNAALTPDPLQSAYCWQPEADREITRLLNQNDYDVVHIEHMRGARYGLSILNARQDGRQIPVVWDSVDSISHLFRQASRQSRAGFSKLITSFELGRTEAYESRLLRSFDHVLVTSTNDRKAFMEMDGNSGMGERISVVNNGVDLEYFCPDERVERDANTVVVSGKLSYHANINMVKFLVDRIMPHVWWERPETRLVIVGKDPPRDIMAMGERPEITVTGTVKDIRPYLLSAAVAVTPITYGAGIQNKVLEAMACGTPVVSTSRAVSALAAVPGDDLLVEDQPELFARAILRLLADSELRQSLGTAGRRFVEKHHNWDTITSNLEVIYSTEIDKKRELQASV